MESRKRPFVLRLAMIALFVSALGMLPGRPVHAAGAVRVEFPGTITFEEVCSDESATVTGPVTVVYHVGAQYSIHLTQKATGVGSLGNTYRVSFVANQQFAEPSAIDGSTLVFTVPFHAQFISKGSAPNFAVNATVDVFVENGEPTGSRFVFEAEDVTCHG